MATYTKTILSQSQFGGPIRLTTSQNNLHVTEVSASVTDEVWMYAHNSSSVSVSLTILYGDVSFNEVKVSIPSQSGLTLVIPGLILTGTGIAAMSVKGYASQADVVTILGYVNRIS